MITVSRTIASPIDVVWELLVTTAQWPTWGFSVTGHVGPAQIEAASTGRIETVVGLDLRYEITEFEPSAYWRWKVGGVPATGHRVTTDPSGSTVVEFESPTWAVAYQPVVWWSLRALEHEATKRTNDRKHERRAETP